MTPLAAAYDNIRLMRRKIRIAQDQALDNPSLKERDAAVRRVADLTEDLARAVQDFADAGFEEEVAMMISGPQLIRAVRQG